MYQAKFINPLVQFNRIEWALVIEDDEMTLPPFRVLKIFHINITASELNIIANNEIVSIYEQLYLKELDDFNNGLLDEVPTLREQETVSAQIDLPQNFNLRD